MSGIISIRQAGPQVSVQDSGRAGYLRFGVSGCGPMDPWAAALANALLMRPHDLPLIEVSLAGLEIEYSGNQTTFAVAGGLFQVHRDGETLPSCGRFHIHDGQKISIRAGAHGAWAYLAFSGDMQVPVVLGSASTHAQSGIGGLNGGPLRTGDRVRLNGAAVLKEGLLPAASNPEKGPAFRLIPGPQHDYFSDDAHRCLFEDSFRLSASCNRMGYKLEGPVLEHAGGHDIVSDGIVAGAIQVPGDGLPIVLMADRQTTGGYPKIAVMARADIGRFAQLRPGQKVRFAAVSVADASGAFRQHHRETERAAARIETRGAGEIDQAALYDSNLISGVTLADYIISDMNYNQGKNPGWPGRIYEVFKSASVAQVCYVPDGGHADLIDLVESDGSIHSVLLTTEEEGVALCTGAWLGGQRSALLMQSSGVGNCLNMLSLVRNCKVPLLALITMRGEWGEFNPWQVPMGSVVEDSLELMGVNSIRVDTPEEVGRNVQAAATMAYDGGAAVAVLLSQKLIGAKEFTR